MIRITRDEMKSAANEYLETVVKEVTQDIDDYNLSLIQQFTLIQKTVNNDLADAEYTNVFLGVSINTISELIAIQFSSGEDAVPSILFQQGVSSSLEQAGLDPGNVLIVPTVQVNRFLDSGRYPIRDITRVKETDLYLGTLALPLKDSLFGTGAAIAGRIRMNKLITHIKSHDFYHKGRIHLVNKDGRPVFGKPDKEIFQTSIMDKAIQMLNTGIATIHVEPFTYPDGKKMLGAYAFPSTMQSAVVLELSEDEAYPAVKRMEHHLLLWVVVGFLLAAFGAIIMAVSLTRPLRRLTRGASRLAEGDLSTRVEGKNRKDEIGELSNAFNKMVKDLEDYIQKLTETTKEKERTESELVLAKKIQQSFLPKTFPAIQEIEVWGKCDPAQGVGGDYFDFFQLDEDHYGLVIGDVSGKGVPAALFMAVSRTLFRILSLKELDTDKVLTEFNHRLFSLDEETNMFITLFYAIYNVHTRKLTYSTAGHNMPYVGKNGDFDLLPSMKKTMVAGMLDDIPMEKADVELQPGDILVLYTDGMLEAVNQNHEEFGEERMKGLLTQYSGLPVQSICKNMIGDVKDFQKGMEQFDDMTMLILKVKEQTCETV